MPPFSRSDFRDLFPVLQYWHALTLPQRQAAMALSHNFQPPVHAFRNLSADLDAQLFESHADGRKRPAAPLRALLAFQIRLAEWSSTQRAHIGTVAVPKYVEAATTHAQRHAMTGVRIGSNPIIASGAFAKRMASGAFSRALAESETPQQFLKAVGGWVPDGGTFATAEHRALREWLRLATPKGNATRLFDRGAFAVPEGSIKPEALAHLACGFGLAMPVLLADTLLPAFTVLAPGKAADQKPANVERKAIKPQESFARPYLLDDIDTWLRALKAEPAPVLGDGWSVPAAHQRRVAKELVTLPRWLPEEGFAAEARSAAALWMIFRLDLAETGQAKPGSEKPGDARLRIQPAGDAWLGRTRKEKAAAVLGWAPFRGKGARSGGKPSERLAFLGDAGARLFPAAAETDTLYAWLDAAFASLRAHCDWETFLRSASEKANPFLADADKDAELAGRWAAWESAPEEVYRKLLSHYAARLASLGALAFAPGPRGSLSVTLAPIGEWLYRHSETWALPAPATAVAVVGADFSVTLLSPDPDAPLELAAFCEPATTGLSGALAGNAFRLTRKSVQAGAHRGLTAAEMLATLESYSKHALPQNVAHEIRSWAGAKKTVRLGESILIESDDPILLAEIRAAFPKDFAEVSPTAIKFQGKGTRAALAKRLARKGFFPEA